MTLTVRGASLLLWHAVKTLHGHGVLKRLSNTTVSGRGSGIGEYSVGRISPMQGLAFIDGEEISVKVLPVK